MVTVRCTGRSFRLVPTRQVVETITYCFAAALAKYDIRVHEFCFLSNHYHLVLTPLGEDLPAFIQDLNSILSRALNALRGWSGSNFEKGYNIVVEQDEESIVAHCAYTLANPCAADLVSRIRHWRGLHSWNMEYGDSLTAKRPRFGLWTPVPVPPSRRKKRRRRPWDRTRARFRGRFVTPDAATIELTRPPAHEGTLRDPEVRELVRGLALEREEAAEAERAEEGRKAMGMKRVRAQDWAAMPRSKEDMFGPEPKDAAANRWAIEEAKQRRREFVQEYRACLEAWLGGHREVVFPAGTYLMRRRFNVAVANAPPG